MKYIRGAAVLEDSLKEARHGGDLKDKNNLTLEESWERGWLFLPERMREEGIRIWNLRLRERKAREDKDTVRKGSQGI